MENIDIQQIESYLRGQMAPEDQREFEVALAADPNLRSRVEELRTLSDGIRQVARLDIRQRAEALRDRIKEEEKAAPQTSSRGKSFLYLLLGFLLGLGLGWLLFMEPEPAQIDRKFIHNEDEVMPVAIPQHEAVATVQILSQRLNKNITLTVMYNPELDQPGAPMRAYALDQGGVGLCVYTRKGDDFWKRELALLYSGQKYYLKIDGDKFLLEDDGAERPFPKEPSTD